MYSDPNHNDYFKLGSRVTISGVGSSTAFAGLKGTISEVQRNERGLTALDKYVVLFEWGEKQTFYSVQLVAAN